MSSAQRGGGSDGHLGRWSPLLVKMGQLKGNRFWLSVEQLLPAKAASEGPFAPLLQGWDRSQQESEDCSSRWRVPEGPSISVHCGRRCLHPCEVEFQYHLHPGHSPETSSTCNDYHYPQPCQVAPICQAPYMHNAFMRNLLVLPPSHVTLSK